VTVTAQPGVVGHCDRECRTVERACEMVVDAADTSFSEILYAAVKDGTDLEKVQRLVCNRCANFCLNTAQRNPPTTQHTAMPAPRLQPVRTQRTHTHTHSQARLPLAPHTHAHTQPG
jgi:hypothetical protein